MCDVMGYEPSVKAASGIERYATQRHATVRCSTAAPAEVTKILSFIKTEIEWIP